MKLILDLVMNKYKHGSVVCQAFKSLDGNVLLQLCMASITYLSAIMNVKMLFASDLIVDIF